MRYVANVRYVMSVIVAAEAGKLYCLLVMSGPSDDDMVAFLKSLGLKGAVGFLELSITGVPLIHIVEAGTIIHSFIHSFIFGRQSFNGI